MTDRMTEDTPMNHHVSTAVRRCTVAVVALAAAAGCGSGDADTEDSIGTDPTVAESSETESPPSDEELEAWADDVVGVYAELGDDQIANAQAFSDIVFAPTESGDMSPSFEMDGYAALTRADAEVVTAALDELPEPPGDPSIDDAYRSFLDALEAEADGAAELADELDTDIEAIRAEAEETAKIDASTGARPEMIRRTFSSLTDDTTAACFDLQTAMTARDLALLDCTVGE